MRGRDRPERGFTLVELLVVMTILAFACGLAALALPGSDHGARDEAERLAARVHAAQQKAVLQSRPIALRISADGYAFEQRGAQGWQSIAESPLAPARWETGTVVSLPAQQARIRFDPTGIADPFAVELRRGDKRVTVRADGRGEIDVAH